MVYSNIKYAKLTGTIDLFLSDHVPVFRIKKKPRNVTHPVKLKARGSCFDTDLLERELNKIDWNFVWVEEDPSDLWDKMFKCIMNIVNRLYPMKEFRVKNDRPDYINDDIIRLGKERDLAFKKAVVSKDENDWHEAVIARRKANSGLRRSKYNFISNNIEDSKGDPNKFWRHVRLLVPNVSAHVIDSVLAEDGLTPLHDLAACNRINDYFCNISVALSSKLKRGMPWSDHGERTDNQEIWVFEVSRDEVVKLIDEVNDQKSSGFLCISGKLLKIILKLIVPQFTFLLNLVLKKATFPVSWKTAITTVIPKSGCTKEVNNLRPISLIPMTGKIMEKILNSIIMDYLESNGKLFVRQGGFRKGRSTVKTAYDLVNHVLLNRNNGLTSATAFIDIAKAFNCINHALLLKKMKSVGFPRLLYQIT